MEIPNSAGNGTDYRLADGVLSVNPGFTGTLTAEYAFTTSPTREIDFEYDHNGLRTQKKVVENGITTIYDYTLHGKLITHLTKRTVDENGDETTQELHFFYDAQSKPAFVEYGGNKYRFLRNLQDDVIGIVDSDGICVVEYKYDAWGRNHVISGTMASTLGIDNPFRYRSYYFDEETLLYYLRSRYYSIALQRFVNADSYDILSQMVGEPFGGNLFFYCKNSSPIGVDDDGDWLNILVGAVAGALISGVVQAVSNWASGEKIMDGVWVAAASGAITGAAAATGIPVSGQVIIGAAVGAGAEFTQQMMDKGEDFDPVDCFIDCTVAGLAGGVSGAIGGSGLLDVNGDVYKQGTRLLKVVSNAESGVYKSASKAASRVVSVGTQYGKTYAKEATKATVKYAIGAVASSAINSFDMPIAKDVAKTNTSIMSVRGPCRLPR